MDDNVPGELLSISREEMELRVLDYELKSLKKDRKIFLQQPNSNIYFLCKKSDALSHLAEERERLQPKHKGKTSS